MRRCESCGNRVPPWQPRRHVAGKRICPECVLANPSVGSLQVEAHDSGDDATIFHCCFCGSGNVVARSDGSAECGFCNTVFTVQVEPQHPFTPQTINGQPYDDPNQPGQITDPLAEGTQPGQPPADEPAPGNEALVFKPPDQPDAEPFDPAAGRAAAARKPFYVGAFGTVLTEDQMLKHLALRHADDPAVVLEQVRAENAGR